jgi:2-desacetyl-2-hydroxyethyl bacteriochlorophyllide A dehydrogenase
VETDGGFAEQVYVAPSKVYAAPERLSHEELALCEPAAVAVHAVSLAQPAGDEFAVVLGAGPIGLLCAQVLRAFGVESVLVSEVSEPKLAIASELGFQTLDARDRRVPETIREANGGRGADIVIEATGVAEAATDIVDAGGNRARIIMVALHKSPTPILFRDLAYREQTIQGARIYADGDFVRAIQLLTAHRIETKPLITHRFALSGYYAAFAAARSPKTCKVVMDLS